MTDYMQIKLDIQNNLNKHENLKLAHATEKFPGSNSCHVVKPTQPCMWKSCISAVGPSLCCPLLHKGFVLAQMF